MLLLALIAVCMVQGRKLAATASGDIAQRAAYIGEWEAWAQTWLKRALALGTVAALLGAWTNANAAGAQAAALACTDAACTVAHTATAVTLDAWGDALVLFAGIVFFL